MYRVIGSDGNQYGPVSADELRRWIGEGRANGQTQVQVEGDPAWQQLGTLPEFAALFDRDSVTPPAPPRHMYGGAPATASIDYSACLRRGYGLFMANKGLLISTLLLYSALYWVTNTVFSWFV